MTNDKLAATFHGAGACGSRSTTPGTTITTEGVQSGAILCCDVTAPHDLHRNGEWQWNSGQLLARTGPSEEEALRAHVADLLTDVDHPQTCIGPAACNCLIGRLNWAIKAEQITTDPTKTAIGVIARSVTEQMLGDAGQEIGDLWADYPEIGESDWQAVVWLVIWRARNGKPDEVTFREAYEHLKGRAEATQDGAA